jgi:hypothetical protein
MDVTMAAAAAFNSKAIQDRDCRSSQRQKRAQGKTSQEHEKDRHPLFIEEHTLGQERMNGFQKMEKIKAAPSNDLDLPGGPQIQNILSIHE